jgi:TonB family protein
MDIGKMARPSIKKKAASSTSSDAPPELLAQPESIAGTSLSENLLSSSSRSLGIGAALPSAPSKGGQLVQPKLISSPAALYPAQARTSQIQGDVAIDAFIDETGKVAATKILSGPPALQQAAMNAVRSWRYQPARLDGQPISIHIRVVVNFLLQ